MKASLRKQLVNKYGHIIVIPPIPSRQLSGNMEEAVVDKRKFELQHFVNRVCSHPILSTAAVWKHFITETDEKVRLKELSQSKSKSKVQVRVQL